MKYHRYSSDSGSVEKADGKLRTFGLTLGIFG